MDSPGYYGLELSDATAVNAAARVPKRGGAATTGAYRDRYFGPRATADQVADRLSLTAAGVAV